MWESKPQIGYISPKFSSFSSFTSFSSFSSFSSSLLTSLPTCYHRQRINSQPLFFDDHVCWAHFNAVQSPTTCYVVVIRSTVIAHVSSTSQYIHRPRVLGLQRSTVAHVLHRHCSTVIDHVSSLSTQYSHHHVSSSSLACCHRPRHLSTVISHFNCPRGG